MILSCCLGKMGFIRSTERERGLFWEKKFGEIIVPYGFSAQETTPTGMDCMIWVENGEVASVQIRHKSPFPWTEIGECYGYERYRLDKDMKLVAEGNIVLYVIHDYTRCGKASDTNEIEDWVAQYMEHLATDIDLEKMGPTWFGDNPKKQIMPICYWCIDKFEPLEQLLENLRQLLLRQF